MKSRVSAIACFLILSSASFLKAQPSGGPYGPMRLAYRIPADAKRVFYVAVDGKGDQSGESISAPTTIESAIEHARTGDAVILRGGVYRTGNLKFNQGITLQPYGDEEPVFKGTFVASDWQNLHNGLWKTSWSRLFPSKPMGWWLRDWEGRKTPLHRFNNDMVFVDGTFLQSAGWQGEVDEHTYYIDYETNTVYIGVDPTNKLVEITAFDVALLRTTKECNGVMSDKKGPTVRGITFTQYAYRAIEIEGTEPEEVMAEAQYGKEVVGTTLEDCTISYCSRVAAYIRGDHLTIRHCRISDTSTEGIYIIASNDVLLEGNIFMRNNIEQITGYYPSAVKIFNQSHRVTCRDNLVTDLPYSNGIWYDVGERDGVFVNNWIENVGNVGKTTPTNQLWPSNNGFFFEISKGAICAGNVFVNCDHGMMILNSANVQVYNNTFVNSMACFGRNGRVAAGDHFGWHASTGPDVDKREGHVFVNNLLTGDGSFTRPLLFVWQPDSMCSRDPNPQLADIDNDVFVRGVDKSNYPLILWSPSSSAGCQAGFALSAELSSIKPEFGAHDKDLIGYDGPLFKGSQLLNFRTLPEFGAANSGRPMPANIRKLLGASGGKNEYVGAYPAEE